MENYIGDARQLHEKGAHRPYYPLLKFFASFLSRKRVPLVP